MNYPSPITSCFNLFECCCGPKQPLESPALTQITKAHNIPIRPLQRGPDVYQLTVLDQLQDGTGRGAETCGFHALKNSLVLTTAIQKRDNKVLDDLTSKTKFLPFCRVVQRAIPNQRGDGDISIQIIFDTIRGLKSGKIKDFPEYGKALRQLETQQAGLSVLSLGLMIDGQTIPTYDPNCHPNLLIA